MKSRFGPNGVHLFDRNTGLNVLLEELRPKESVWSISPRQVSIALTNLCDLRCAHCFAPKHKALLHTDQVLTWLKELDTEGCLGIGFGGGEPTLHPDFVEICKRAAGETHLAVTFTTHGHRLTQPLVKKLKGSIHFARISVDGIGHTYEEQRGRQFSSLLRGIESIAKLSSFGINVVINERTIFELTQWLSWRNSLVLVNCCCCLSKQLMQSQVWTNWSAESFKTGSLAIEERFDLQ